MSVAEMTAAGLPTAISIRLVSMVAAFASARRPRLSRGLALAGSIAASLITTALAARVLISGTAISGVLARHVPSGLVLGYTVTPLSAWFVAVLGLVAVPTVGGGPGPWVAQPVVRRQVVVCR